MDTPVNYLVDDAVMVSTAEKQVLIVDDDEDACATLSDILTDLGYQVDISYRGLNALDLLKQHQYPLVLLDYKLPCMTGVELFERMRGINEDVNGLLISAFVSAEAEEKALDRGMRSVFSKPVDVPQLLPLIEAALR